MSLTAVSVAKAIHWFATENENRKPFSIADIKTISYNELLLNQFLRMFAIKPNILKNNQKLKELLFFGTKAP
ncbi:MAG: hypothetical protein LBV74_04675 [Tannerella sp.]|jgi:hypothetical protein|nr:hypothetical protein [Tannerella sp.]